MFSLKEFSNENELVSWIVPENNDPANIPDVEQEEYVDSCNVKLTIKAGTSSIEILHKYFEKIWYKRFSSKFNWNEVYHKSFTNHVKTIKNHNFFTAMICP